MELDKLIDKLTFYEGFLDAFIEKGKHTLRNLDLDNLFVLKNYLIKAKEHLKDTNKCEFFNICKHKFLRPKPTIIELKEEDLDIKSWCNDLNELLTTTRCNYVVKCTIREKVLKLLEGS